MCEDTVKGINNQKCYFIFMTAIFSIFMTASFSVIFMTAVFSFLRTMAFMSFSECTQQRLKMEIPTGRLLLFLEGS